MGTKTIDQLPAAAPLTGAEEVPAWQGAGTVKTTTQDIADLAATAGTPLPIGRGGTGQTTAQAALDALFAAVTKGTMWIGDGTHVSGLAVGADGKVLTADSGASHGVSWQTPAAGGVPSVNGIAVAVNVQGTTGHVVVNTASPNITIDLPSTLDMSGGAFTINGPVLATFQMQASGNVLMQPGTGHVWQAASADFSSQLEVSSGGNVLVNGNTLISLAGPLGSDQTAVATTLGTVIARLAIADLGGTLIGYLPLYDTIT